MTTHKTYSFSTFQELLDVVPADRIAECMREMGIAFAGAKSAAELVYITAVALAKVDGVELPPMPARLLEVPAVHEWIDDGKGELSATIMKPGGEEFMTVKMGPKATA